MQLLYLHVHADGCGGGGWLNPILSLFAGGWDVVVVHTDGFGVKEVEDSVAVLVDGCGTGVERCQRLTCRGGGDV